MSSSVLRGPMVLAVLGYIVPAQAQDIKPRAYSNAPIGVNFIVTGYAYTQGALSFDPSLALTNADLRAHNAVIGYARVLDLGGKSGIFDVIVPYTFLSGTADYEGAPVQREVDGVSNPAFRLSWNFYGAPAMGLKEFSTWQQHLVIGASLRVSAPWSQYDSSRLINIGTNRWSFKPEIGISRTIGQWTVEGQLAATIFTDNTDFFGGNTREQDPMYSAQAHAIYGFKSGCAAVPPIPSSSRRCTSCASERTPTLVITRPPGGIKNSGGDMGSAISGAMLAISWEPDLWGRLRYGRNAANEEYASAQADYEFARQSLAAQVARSWFIATETKLQLAAAQDMVGSSQQLVRLSEDRQRIGPGNNRDVSLVRANVGNLEDGVRQASLAHQQALRSLELLLGRYPSAELEAAPELAKIPDPVPVGMPLDVLERRPDMVAAERRVATASTVSARPRPPSCRACR